MLKKDVLYWNFAETIYFLTRDQHPEQDLVEMGYL